MITAPFEIEPLSEAQRANDYPYEAPSYDLVVEGRQCRAFTSRDRDALEERIAVLSVGSNRSPQQLLRKFGDESYLPVTNVILKNCDVIHSACFSYYGAVPCTAYPCEGTDIALNAVWLTESQLQIMHDTEAVGIAYDFCRWHDDQMTFVEGASPGDVFGYATRLGFFADRKGQPFALSALQATRRIFTNYDQFQARAHLYECLPQTLKQTDLARFIEAIQTDKVYRTDVNAYLGEISLPIAQGEWQLRDATTQQAERFL